MKLVDEIKFKKLLSALKIEETVSGGSVANSIVESLHARVAKAGAPEPPIRSCPFAPAAETPSAPVLFP